MKKILMGITILLLTVLNSCSQPQPSESDIQTAIHKTSDAEMSQASEIPATPTVDTFELTKQANQTSNAIYYLTQEAKPTSPPGPTKIPTKRPSSTPTESVEEIREELESLLINDFEDSRDIERVNILKFDGMGTFEIELINTFASKDYQPNISFVVITNLALLFGDWGESSIKILFGSEAPVIHIVTYSTNLDYRYESLTTIDTIRKIYNREISYEEWVMEANAGFK